MGIFAAILFVLGTVAAVFGWWGQHTRAGQLKYDEMAGMIPFFAWWTGLVLIAIAIIVMIVMAVKRPEEPTVSGPLSSDTTPDLYDPEEG